MSVRGITLARVAAIALLVSVVSLVSLVSGCGQRAVAPVLDSAIATPTVTPSPAPSCSSTGVTVTNADNGETLCVRPGAAVLVLLSDATGDIRVTGPLTAHPEVLPMLVPGVKGAAYAASEPGVATITSVLSPCGTGPGIHCMLLMLFRVTIDITRSQAA
jgi:hypothetical protein